MALSGAWNFRDVAEETGLRPGRFFRSSQLSGLSDEGRRRFVDLGITFTEEFYEQSYSPNWYAMYEALNLAKDRWETADALWLEHYGEQPPKLVAGAATTILELQSRGYNLGIVTSGTERRVRRELKQLGLITSFKPVICNEHIVNKKPHPEGLELAMHGINVDSSECAYVGDAPEDIEMGRRGNVMTIGVRSAYPSSARVLTAKPDLYLDRIAELVNHF